MCKLIESALKLKEAAENEARDVLGKYAEEFHADVLVPFCDKYKLRFWSGNGDWWWESPAGYMLKAEGTTLKWSIAAGHAWTRGDGTGWTLGIQREDMPEFFRLLNEIDDILHSEYYGGCFGFWVDGYRQQEPTIRDLPFYMACSTY